MSLRELRRIGRAAQDPAVTFLALIPLAVLHLSGRDAGGNGALGMVENLLAPVGGAANWVLAGLLAVVALWSIGRIRGLELPWIGGACMTLTEGAIWGLVMGPVLVHLTDWVTPGAEPPLGAGSLAAGLAEVHGTLALAAGAGLYEELVFRAGLLAGLAVLIQTLLRGMGWREAAPTAGFGLALVASALGFALAHKLGDPDALQSRVLAFRFLAGILLGGLYAWRGLGVVAWAHAAYDAYLLL